MPHAGAASTASLAELPYVHPYTAVRHLQPTWPAYHIYAPTARAPAVATGPNHVDTCAGPRPLNNQALCPA